MLDIITSTSTSFWSQSIHSDLILEESLPSPSLAHTLFKIYKSSPSFTASAFFKIKLIWLSDLRFVPYDKRSLMVPVAISISAPQYLLDVQSLPSLPSGIPISSDVQFWYQWQKITRFNVQPSHLIFLYEWYPQPQLCWAAKNQKGPHPETRWNLCFGEHIICISFAFHYKSPCAEFDSRQILFARLRKMVSLLP